MKSVSDLGKVGISLLTGGLLVTTLQTQAADPAAAPADSQVQAQVQVQQAEAATPLPAAIEAVPAETPAPVTADSAANDSTTELDTQVIRAKPRIQRLQNTPQSVSVVTGKELDRLDAVDLGAITSRAANVTWNLGNSRTSSLSIRGVGKQAQTDAMDPSVGLVVDGVAYAYNPLASFDFTDLDAVEVLRGPQGTLGGKNASLGVINIITRRPSFTPEAETSLTFGQDRTVIARATIGGPVIDNLLAWRGVVSVDKGDGAIKNNYNTDYSYKNRDNVAGRLAFLLTPADNFNATLRLDLEPRHSEYYNGWVLYKPTPTQYANGATNNLATDASTRLARRWFTQEGNYSYLADYLGDNPNLDNQMPLVTSSRGSSLELNWIVGGHTLTSITAYKDYQFQARNDEGTPFDISKNGGGHVFYQQTSQELRLSSPTGGFLDYTTGLYFVDTHNNYDSGTGYGSDAGAWFASSGQYSNLDQDGAGRYLLGNSLNRLVFKPLQEIRNESLAWYGNINWHLSDPLTVTTGLRLSREDRENTVSKLIYDQGFAPELNPVLAGTYPAGGFDSNATTGELGSNDAVQLALADATAQKYFGVAYAALSSNQKKQIANAKALRAAQLGVLYNPVAGPKFQRIQPTIVVSPSYKINPNVTSYVTYQHGEKAGISEVTASGNPLLAAPEKTDSYEIGVKSTLLDNTLVFNADVFLSNIKNYQQLAYQFDPIATAQAGGVSQFTSITGNAPKVQVRGVEIDGVYNGIRDFSLRFSLAYNDAFYKSFTQSGQPLENGNLSAKFRDVTGQNLPGAAKITGNVGVDYSHAVFNSKVIHTSLNYAYTSRYNSDVALSSYGWVPGYGTADFSLGLGRTDKKFDVSFLVKNLFNDQTSQVVTWNSYVPAVPRWFGIGFSAKVE